MPSLSNEDIAELRKLAEGSLYFFCKGILGYKDMVPHIHGKACLELEKMHPLYRVIFPRSWFKSTLASVALPLWLGSKMGWDSLVVQNSDKNSARKLREAKRQATENSIFRAVFPEVKPGSPWGANQANFTKFSMDAAGTKSKVVSRHYDFIAEDDTATPDLDDYTDENVIPSKEDIAQAIGWHRQVFPLFKDPSNYMNVLIGTRWYETDLLQWSKENEPHGITIERAVRESEGKPSPDGEPAWPERFGEDVLKRAEAMMGPYLFSCLYMNHPMHSEDMVFQSEWIQYYETAPRKLVVYTTVDPGGEKSNSDFNAVVTCGKDMATGRIYILDIFHKRTTPSELIYAIMTHIKQYSPQVVGIESIAYQKSLMFTLREQMRASSLWATIKPFTGWKSSKEVRIRGLQPVFANKDIMLRRWMQPLVQELLTFPYGSNDDMIDALSMQLELWPLTKSAREVKKEEKNPDSWAAILEEIDAQASRKSSILDDIMQIDQETFDVTFSYTF